MRPFPPFMGVPPMTTAPMACISMPEPVEGWAAPILDRSIVAAMPTRSPLMREEDQLVRW